MEPPYDLWLTRSRVEVTAFWLNSLPMPLSGSARTKPEAELFVRAPGIKSGQAMKRSGLQRMIPPPFRLAKDGLHRTLVLYRVFMAHDMDIHARTSER